MPFDPLDFRFERPMPPRPGPSAPTHLHGLAMLMGFAVMALLLLMMLNITYTIEAIGEASDLLGL